ncbi:MAG: DUF5916 domain-containing protein [Ignavibacteria bacterium]|nr:DUF5916 domain-containing protein [Ignavibacteria bacterium]
MRKIFLLLFITTINFAGEALKPTRISTPPAIDGKLEDVEWNSVLSVSTFKTFSPDFGKEASQKTVAYAGYDSENLYFAFRCYDTEPDKIKTSVNSRDNIRPDDWVCINLDSFFDQQSLYAFYINPNGIQTDSRYAANIEDFSADFVWYSAGQMLPDGYSIEISIPLKSIRYSDANPVTMSIFFERYISRLIEHSSFPELDPKLGMAFLMQMTPLEYRDLEHYTLFELLPAFTYSNKYARSKNELTRTENKGDLSLTAKCGITSDLILDATYNPDFSQVESDAGQVDVNLRYSLFFAEKRPFFLEGSEIFNVAGLGTSEVDPLGTLVHTRTIVNPLTGLKLSGKLGTKNTLAALFSMDELPNDTDGKYASFPILRFKRTLSEDSYVGAIYTGRETKNNFNRVAAVDGIFRVTPSSTFEWNGIFSNTKYSGIDKAKDGSVVSLRYAMDSRDLYYDFSLKNISQDFFVETGYLTRNGVLSLTGLVRPKLYPTDSFISRIDLEAFSALLNDKPSSKWETYNYVSAQAYMFGSLTAKIRLNYATEIFEGEKFNTGGIALYFRGQFIKELASTIIYKRVNAIYYSSSPFQGYSNRFSAEITFSPTQNIESYTSFVFSDFRRSTDDELIYEYPIIRERLTYQVNKYLFFRGIAEYNKFKKQLLTDFLVSFTYVPGTVMHLGYGALYNRTEWDEPQNRYIASNSFNQVQRGFFFKMSYLWRT